MPSMPELSPEPRLAVVIPSGDASRNRNLEKLLEDLQARTRPPDEVEVVRGVRPNGHARNVGASHTTAEILVFLDDDVRLGSPEVLSVLANILASQPDVGLVGTAQQLPPGSTVFQRAAPRDIARSQSSIVDVLTDSDMVTPVLAIAARSWSKSAAFTIGSSEAWTRSSASAYGGTAIALPLHRTCGTFTHAPTAPHPCPHGLA